MFDFEAGRDSPDTRKSVKRCHHSHPALKIGGGVIEGGACGDPNLKADYLILLDDFQRGIFLPPWEGRFQIRFPIRDGDAPDPKKLDKLVDWIGGELAKGKKFHIGCFAGHGRTGTVLAAIVAKVHGEPDAIKWLRKNYCKKAVESHAQVDMLVKHFGVKKAAPSKAHVRRDEFGGGGSSKWGKGSWDTWGSTSPTKSSRSMVSRGKKSPSSTVPGATYTKGDTVVVEPRSGRSIFD